jgi:TRAP-type C4-dicarboxylate transport system substrate-binding protein
MVNTYIYSRNPFVRPFLFDHLITLFNQLKGETLRELKKHVEEKLFRILAIDIH